MKPRRYLSMLLCTAAAIILLFLPQIVKEQVLLGIELCIKTIIPALFPFLLLTIWASDIIVSFRFKILKPIAKLFCIDPNAMYIYITGLLGGYPTGAQLIYQAYKEKRLSHDGAQRLLFFCNNPGPAFIFAISSILFTELYYGWILWGIQILSSLICARIAKPLKIMDPVQKSHGTDLPKALEKACKVMMLICGWVICFRIMIGVMEHMIPRSKPSTVTIVISGLLELSNGCLSLANIPDAGLRFVFLCGFLSFGGLCVTMQTASVVHELGICSYIRGKLLQTVISVSMGLIAQAILLQARIRFTFIYLTGFLVLLTTILLIRKITVAFRKKALYNI